MNDYTYISPEDQMYLVALELLAYELGIIDIDVYAFMDWA